MRLGAAVVLVWHRFVSRASGGSGPACVACSVSSRAVRRATSLRPRLGFEKMSPVCRRPGLGPFPPAIEHVRWESPASGILTFAVCGFLQSVFGSSLAVAWPWGRRCGLALGLSLWGCRCGLALGLSLWGGALGLSLWGGALWWSLWGGCGCGGGAGRRAWLGLGCCCDPASGWASERICGRLLSGLLGRFGFGDWAVDS